MPLMMLKADIYLARMDLRRYWPLNAPIKYEDFLAQLKAGKDRIEDCPFLTSKQLQAFKLALEAETYLPPVPQTTMPRPMEAGLFPVNEPDENSLVVLSGNNSLTFEVLASVWAQGVTPAYFLLVECLGSTVDMAMIYGDFTPARLEQILKRTTIEEKVKHRHMIVPGFTAPLVRDFASVTGWEIEAGPICAAELPLFLGDRWIFPERQK